MATDPASRLGRIFDDRPRLRLETIEQRAHHKLGKLDGLISHGEETRGRDDH